MGEVGENKRYDNGRKEDEEATNSPNKENDKTMNEYEDYVTCSG